MPYRKGDIVDKRGKRKNTRRAHVLRWLKSHKDKVAELLSSLRSK